MAQLFNPNNQEAEARGSLMSLRLSCSLLKVPSVVVLDGIINILAKQTSKMHSSMASVSVPTFVFLP